MEHDNVNGPCVCGAWHSDGELPPLDEIRILRRVRDFNQADVLRLRSERDAAQNSLGAAHCDLNDAMKALQKIADMDGPDYPIAFARCVTVAREALKPITKGTAQ